MPAIAWVAVVVVHAMAVAARPIVREASGAHLLDVLDSEHAIRVNAIEHVKYLQNERAADGRERAADALEELVLSLIHI